MIVADWVMPEMDGLELCRALRRFDAGRRIFFMLVTGREEESRMIEAFEAGVDDFITKPFRPKPFIARVRGATRMIALRNELEQEKHRLRAELGRTKLLTRKLSMAALTDMLTELPNRRYAIKRLADDWANAERTGKPLSVIVVDIDNFKTINDTYGHDVGDEVLRATAALLEKGTRKGESACRFGGEEFLIICHDCDIEAAAQCAERIRRSIADTTFRCGEFEGGITISAGVAERMPSVRDLDHLIKIADEATYAAKDRGRNRTVLASSSGGPGREYKAVG
jgi:diguanylate cyclase (GGDEF)-like protein